MYDEKAVAEAVKLQGQEIALTAKFMSLMDFGNKPQNNAVTYGTQFDSILANAKESNSDKALFMPSALLTIEKALEGKKQPDGSKSFNGILDSVATGIKAYRNRNGGDMPSPALVASALNNGALLYEGLNGGNTQGIYDSAKTGNQSAKEFFVDSVSSGQSSHVAEVPALAMVTIATTIANALPIVAYLPNPKGTQTVPLVYVRQVSKNAYGQMGAHDFLDGANAGAQYFDAVHRLAMTSADQTTFTVKAYRRSDKETLVPDDASGRLPMVGEATLITIGGIPVFEGDQSRGMGGQVAGSVQLRSIDLGDFEYEGQAYKLVSGTVNLDTDTVTFTLDKALPAGAKAVAHVVANYELKDGNGQPVLTAPSVDAKLDYSSISAYGIRAIYTASIDALTQMQNELGVDMRSAFVAVVISKLMLEQNVRLLSQARSRAIGQGTYRAVDLSRGSDMTQAFNNTSAVASEILPAIEDSKRRIIEKSQHAPAGFDIYVSGQLGTLMKILADDTNFIPTGLTLGAPNNIVRIGSRGSDNFYYLPTDLGVLEDGETDVGGVTVAFAEALIVARSAEPAKSVFVGHIAVPVVTDDVRAVAFESGVQFYTRQACQMNKNKRFGSQVALLKVMNLPKSLTTAVS